MKRMRAQNLIGTALLALGLCCALAAQPQCSIQNVVGTWGYTGIGWSIPAGGSAPAPLTMIGIIVIDYSGKETGPGTFVSGAPVPGTPIPAGQPLDFDIVNATVQVNADCTALLKYSIQLKGMPVPPIGPYFDRLVVVPNGGEFLEMSVQSPISKPFWIYTFKRMSPVPAPVSWPAVPAQ